MQVELSMTITPAEPSPVPILDNESKSRLTSHSSAVSTGTDDPPGMQAFSGRSSCSIPPPRS